MAARDEDDFFGAQALREVVRGKADAALGRIEAEVGAHRAAQPGIAARLRRPGAFVEAAQHDTLEGLQARFQRAEDAHAHVGRLRAAHHALGDGGMEQFGIVAFGDAKRGGGGTFGQFLEGAKKRYAVIVGEGGDLAFAIPAKPGNHGAVAFGELGKRMRARLQPLQRRQRRAEPGDQFGGHVELVVVDQPARVAAVQLGAVGAESGERTAERVAARARTRAAQQRALQRCDGGMVRAGFGAEPQQRMLEQRQQRHRLQAAERGFRRKPCEHAGRRVGERVAAGVVRP